MTDVTINPHPQMPILHWGGDMKAQSFLAMVMATLLSQPTGVLAHDIRDHTPLPHDRLQRATPGGPDVEKRSPLPSRRIPGQTPPHADGPHPMTPDEAWPDMLSKPERRPGRPDMPGDRNDAKLLDSKLPDGQGDD